MTNRDVAKSRLSRFFLVFLLLLPPTSHTDERRDIERKLKAQYEGKVFRMIYAPTITAFQVKLPKEERDSIDVGAPVYLRINNLRLTRKGVEFRAQRTVFYRDHENTLRAVAAREANYGLLWQEKGAFEMLLPDALNQLFRPVMSAGEEWDRRSQMQPAADALAPLGQPPSTTKDGTGALRIGGGVSPPVCLFCTEPDYPEDARQEKIMGTVILWVIVTETGYPVSISVHRSVDHRLDAAAALAASRWRFKPAMRSGTPVPVMFLVEVNFRLY